MALRLASHWTTGSEGLQWPVLLIAAVPYVVAALIGLWLWRRLRRGQESGNGGAD